MSACSAMCLSNRGRSRKLQAHTGQEKAARHRWLRQCHSRAHRDGWGSWHTAQRRDWAHTWLRRCSRTAYGEGKGTKCAGSGQ